MVFIVVIIVLLFYCVLVLMSVSCPEYTTGIRLRELILLGLLAVSGCLFKKQKFGQDGSRT